MREASTEKYHFAYEDCQLQKMAKTKVNKEK